MDEQFHLSAEVSMETYASVGAWLSLCHLDALRTKCMRELAETGKGDPIPQNWSSRWLLVVSWVLGTELGSSASAAIILSSLLLTFS